MELAGASYYYQVIVATVAQLKSEAPETACTNS